MLKFAANLTVMFTEIPFLERFAAARAAGFTAVEVLFPYDIAATDIIARLAAQDLKLVLINCPPPNYTDGPRGFAAIPGGQERFRHDFRRALRYAKAMGARHLHLMSGIAAGEEARATLVENLRWAAAQAPDQSLTIEPINTADMPGYFLDSFDLAAGVLDEVGAANVNLQFDAYHAHRITGDVAATWDRHGARAVHVQIAGHPGRHEPKGGEIDYPAFFRRLEAQGYKGWISGEYTPQGKTDEGLGWMRTR